MLTNTVSLRREQTSLANGTVAVDILEVPISCNNRYVLVIQDYFTKWPDGVHLPDRTRARTSSELVKLFPYRARQMYSVLHFDQGQNFESSTLSQVFQAFNIAKTHTTAYHPQGDGTVERFNQSLTVTEVVCSASPTGFVYMSQFCPCFYWRLSLHTDVWQATQDTSWSHDSL